MMCESGGQNRDMEVVVDGRVEREGGVKGGGRGEWLSEQEEDRWGGRGGGV